MEIPQNRLLYLAIALLSFLVGVVAVQFVGLNVIETRLDPNNVAETVVMPVEPREPTPYDFPPENCYLEWDDFDVPLQPIVDKWLRNEEIKDVAYCSKTATEAPGFDSSNVLPEFVDLNDDGVDELAVRFGCSMTSNCSMNIYQRVGKSSRKIFTDRQAVSYFDKVGGKYKGFRDLQTRSHGSCCDGDQVIYRFSGNAYKPISCAEYSYWDRNNDGEVEETPTIIPRSCRKALDSR